MQYIEIEGLLIDTSGQSSVKKYNRDLGKIREEISDKLRQQYIEVKEKTDTGIQEEESIIARITELVNNDDYRYICGNRNYREKVLKVFDNNELHVGKAQVRLCRIEDSLKGIESAYQVAYEKYVVSARESLENEMSQVGSILKKEFQEHFEELLLSKQMFNELSNASIISF